MTPYERQIIGRLARNYDTIIAAKSIIEWANDNWLTDCQYVRTLYLAYYARQEKLLKRGRI